MVPIHECPLEGFPSVGEKSCFAKSPSQSRSAVKNRVSRSPHRGGSERAESGGEVVEGRYWWKREHVQEGVSPFAHRVAKSLWLHKLSITEGFLVKTMAGEGD